MQTLMRGGRVIDPAVGFDGTADVLVTDGSVSAVGPGLDTPPGATLIDVTGLVVGPGSSTSTATCTRSPGTGCRPWTG